MRPAWVVAGTLLAAALAACGSQDTACPASVDSSAAASPNPNADPDLAASFPDTVAGEQLEVATFCATELDLGGIETSREMLDAVGVSLAEVTVAAVPPRIGTPGGTFSVGAYRFAGADEDVVRETFLRLFREAADQIDLDALVDEVTIGGKDVHRILGVVYYVSGDRLYSVQSDDDAKVEEILEALP